LLYNIHLSFENKNKYIYDNINTLGVKLDSISEIKLEYLFDSLFIAKNDKEKILYDIKEEYSKNKIL
jgi:hypothetical protein